MLDVVLKQFRLSKDIGVLDFPLAGTYKYGVNFMIAGIYAIENIIRYIVYSFNATLRRRFLGRYTSYAFYCYLPGH